MGCEGGVPWGVREGSHGGLRVKSKTCHSAVESNSGVGAYDSVVKYDTRVVAFGLLSLYQPTRRVGVLCGVRSNIVKRSLRTLQTITTPESVSLNTYAIFNINVLNTRTLQSSAAQGSFS